MELSFAHTDHGFCSALRELIRLIYMSRPFSLRSMKSCRRMRSLVTCGSEVARTMRLAKLGCIIPLASSQRTSLFIASHSSMQHYWASSETIRHHIAVWCAVWRYPQTEKVTCLDIARCNRRRVSWCSIFQNVLMLTVTTPVMTAALRPPSTLQRLLIAFRYVFPVVDNDPSLFVKGQTLPSPAPLLGP